MNEQFPIRGQFKGIISDVPGPTDPLAFDDTLNVLGRKNRISTRPRLNPLYNSPDGAIIRNMITFTDVLNNIHTLVLTTKNAYMLTAGGVFNLLTYPAGVTNLVGTSQPYTWQNILGRVYFSNGSTKLLYTAGEAGLVDANSPGSCFFLSENAGHLIQAYTIEPGPGVVGSKAYPYRIRWSKNGDATDWTAYSSGFADMFEVTDQITGLATLGVNTFVWRTNGISIMSPTGQAIAPFDIQNYSLSPKGVGNNYPYSLAVFNDIGTFIAKNDIYSLSPGGIQPLGQFKAKKKIFQDIANSSGDQIVGWIVPSMGPIYDALSYWLSIPGVNYTWVYLYDEASWYKVYTSQGRLTFVEAVTIA